MFSSLFESVLFSILTCYVVHAGLPNAICFISVAIFLRTTAYNSI